MLHWFREASLAVAPGMVPPRFSYNPQVKQPFLPSLGASINLGGQNSWGSQSTFSLNLTAQAGFSFSPVNSLPLGTNWTSQGMTRFFGFSWPVFSFPLLNLPKSAALINPPISGTTAPEKVLNLVKYIEKRLVTSVYKADTKIDLDKGNFEFDCSGMVNWILSLTAPVANAELKSERAQVATYVKLLQSIPYDQPTQGWRRLKRVADAEPGDVLAWPTPKDWYPSNATGHMGIVVAKPEAVSGGYLIRIADSTSLPHGEDTRESTSGFGYGTVLIVTDPDTGVGIGQGWTGRYSGNTVLKTPILVGRPLR